MQINIDKFINTICTDCGYSEETEQRIGVYCPQCSAANQFFIDEERLLDTVAALGREFDPKQLQIEYMMQNSFQTQEVKHYVKSKLSERLFLKLLDFYDEIIQNLTSHTILKQMLSFSAGRLVREVDRLRLGVQKRLDAITQDALANPVAALLEIYGKKLETFNSLRNLLEIKDKEAPHDAEIYWKELKSLEAELMNILTKIEKIDADLVKRSIFSDSLSRLMKATGNNVTEKRMHLEYKLILDIMHNFYSFDLSEQQSQGGIIYA